MDYAESHANCTAVGEYLVTKKSCVTAEIGNKITRVKKSVKRMKKSLMVLQTSSYHLMTEERGNYALKKGVVL